MLPQAELKAQAYCGPEKGTENRESRDMLCNTAARRADARKAHSTQGRYSSSSGERFATGFIWRPWLVPERQVYEDGAHDTLVLDEPHRPVAHPGGGFA